jgi:hypothetical protein
MGLAARQLHELSLDTDVCRVALAAAEAKRGALDVLVDAAPVDADLLERRAIYLGRGRAVGAEQGQVAAATARPLPSGTARWIVANRVARFFAARPTERGAVDHAWAWLHGLGRAERSAHDEGVADAGVGAARGAQAHTRRKDLAALALAGGNAGVVAHTGHGMRVLVVAGVVIKQPRDAPALTAASAKARLNRFGASAANALLRPAGCGARHDVVARGQNVDPVEAKKGLGRVQANVRRSAGAWVAGVLGSRRHSGEKRDGEGTAENVHGCACFNRFGLSTVVEPTDGARPVDGELGLSRDEPGSRRRCR